ncbi:MAG: hypothetical protein IPJ38_14990 [Dechloromonas sp.]|uniref:Cupin domain-containing protein n=1 Tax=Candidatus Dechloromonas phosphorivorans TaxID=2899244 RepID=A0A935N267_9RHOO|nr:hypothetical protein [Candidatus Dechloromonas phosphorivorans]
METSGRFANPSRIDFDLSEVYQFAPNPSHAMPHTHPKRGYWVLLKLALHCGETPDIPSPVELFFKPGHPHFQKNCQRL